MWKRAPKYKKIQQILIIKKNINFVYKKKYKFRLSIKKLLPSKTKTQKFINSMVFVN
jgi:hypothetical protein